jgi:hypothetical protein
MTMAAATPGTSRVMAMRVFLRNCFISISAGLAGAVIFMVSVWAA